MIKRNRFGINLDEGIPLITETDYTLLYVDCFSDITKKLNSWIETKKTPLLISGQIGSGKSTLINKALHESATKPDITLHFDQESLNLGIGDFWGIVLAGFINTSIKQNVDLSFSILPKELGGYQSNDWSALLEGLEPKTFSLDSYLKKVELRKKISEISDYISHIVTEIGRCIQDTLNRPLFLFCSGVDKFDMSSAAFFSIQEVIPTLCEFKTLFEVNIVHLFTKIGTPLYSVGDRLLISTAKNEDMTEMLYKRMGIYAQTISREIDILSHWSGGNPRQAIRLLSHYETAIQNRQHNNSESIAIAINETTSDFFSYSPKPSADLMKVTSRAARIETSLISLPGDKDTARMAIYGNWILINGTSDGTSLPVSINPLIKATFEVSLTIEPPETRLWAAYAASTSTSATGLGMKLHDEKGMKKSGDQLLWEYLSSGVEEPIHLNISKSLDLLGGALLSSDRADRVIIAFKDHDVIEAARSYLFAKANSYEYQRCNHFIFEGGSNKQPLFELERHLQEKMDIISLEFSGQWDSAQLEALDKQRDKFIDYQMIWWIPYNNLKKYLIHWTQLRQLFEIFVLEDELLGSLSSDEIVQDLEFYQNIEEDNTGAAVNVVSNLKIVLDYINRVRERTNNE